ncbi:MAG: M20/M25/M40 family metallo-hydrolase [Acidobacteria bacterium]|nr:M20/M25/M40 family metallo-hydrolase [Acidobacteriota bacterium]
MKSSAIAVGIALAVCSPRPAPAQSPDPVYDAAIRALAATPEVRRALAFARTLERTAEAPLIELTQVPAPPFGETERGRRFAELLRARGLADVTIDEAGNVIARRAGTAGPEAVAVVAHLDTVFPAGTDVTVYRRGNRLYAPGIGDDTRGLVVLLIIADALERAAVRTRADVLLVGSVGEEGLGDLRGVRHLLRPGGPRIDQFIAIDGGSDEEVVNQALGSRRYRVTVTGPGGHSWGDFGLANPAHALARAIDYFDRAASAVDGVGTSASYSVGRIGGGTSVNAVPREAWAEVDMRSTDPERLDRLDAVLQSSVARAVDEQNGIRDRGAPLDIELELIGDRPSGLVDPRAPLVRRALAATRFFGLQPRLGAASTDANLPIAFGIPAVTLGRGGVGGGAHSVDEWWSPRDAHVGTQRALLLLLAAAGVAR